MKTQCQPLKMTKERKIKILKKLKELEKAERKKYPKSKITYSNIHGSHSTKPDGLL